MKKMLSFALSISLLLISSDTLCVKKLLRCPLPNKEARVTQPVLYPAVYPYPVFYYEDIFEGNISETDMHQLCNLSKKLLATSILIVITAYTIYCMNK